MKKKIISLALVVAMVAIMLTSFTMAYFTDTDAAENVFTVGNIDIELHEKNTAGAHDDAYRTWLKAQNIMPGEKLDKIVWVKNAGNEPAYVRVTITVPDGMNAVFPSDTGDWTSTFMGNGVYVYTSETPLAAGAETPALLEKMELLASVTELNALAEYNVTVNVEAIQADSFQTANEAYLALSSANVAKKATAASASEANTALAADNAVVQLSDDIKSETNIVMGTNTALDGNGKTIYKDASKINSEVDKNNAGVNTAGGTIKNVTVSGTPSADNYGFRAIYAKTGLKSDLIIDSAVLNGTYAININSASNYGLSVSNTKLNGWVSYDAVASATFNKCDFNGGTYNTYRPYSDSVLNDCTFTEKYNISVGKNCEGLTIELNNCTVGVEKLTAANFTSLFAMADDEYTAALKKCNVIVDGVSVVFPKNP